MKEKGFAHVLLLLIVTGVVVLFSPIPSYNPRKANCLLIDDCPKSRFSWKPSMYQNIKSRIYVVGDFNKLASEARDKEHTRTTDKETYISHEHGFLLHYPTNWTIEEAEPLQQTEGQEYFLLENTNEETANITIIVTESSLWDQDVESGFDHFKANGTINDIPAMITVRGETDSRPTDMIVVQAPSSNYYVSFVFDYTKTNKSIIDTILSTFEFIDNHARYPFEGRFVVYRIDTVDDKLILTTHLEMTSTEGEMEKACLWIDDDSENKQCSDFNELMQIPLNAGSNYVYAEVTDEKGNTQLLRDSIFGGAPGIIAE